METSEMMSLATKSFIKFAEKYLKDEVAIYFNEPIMPKEVLKPIFVKFGKKSEIENIKRDIDGKRLKSEVVATVRDHWYIFSNLSPRVREKLAKLRAKDDKCAYESRYVDTDHDDGYYEICRSEKVKKILYALAANVES